MAAYKRILLKLSGEALMGEQPFGIDPAVATQVAHEIGDVQAMGVQIGVVIGGGNLFRRDIGGVDHVEVFGECDARLAATATAIPHRIVRR